MHRPRNPESLFVPDRPVHVRFETYEVSCFLNIIFIYCFQNNFEHQSGQPAQRSDLMMVLADLDAFLIRASHVSDQSSTRLVSNSKKVYWVSSIWKLHSNFKQLYEKQKLTEPKADTEESIRLSPLTLFITKIFSRSHQQHIKRSNKSSFLWSCEFLCGCWNFSDSWRATKLVLRPACHIYALATTISHFIILKSLNLAYELYDQFYWVQSRHPI